MKRKETQRNDTGNLWCKYVTEVLKGGILAGILTLVLIALWAVLIAGGVVGERWMQLAVLSSCVIGSAAGGLLTKKWVKTGGWVIGGCVGGVLYLMLLTLGVVIYGSVSMEEGGGSILAACLCGGMLAAALGRRERKSKRKTMRRAHL